MTQKQVFINFQRIDFETKTKLHNNWSGCDVIPLITKREKHFNKVLVKLWTENFDLIKWLPNFVGKVKVVHYRFYLLVQSDLFNNLLTVMVFGNTLILALTGMITDEPTLALFDTLNEIFTDTFIFELTAKIVALGPSEYLSDKMNIFDGFIVMISIFEKIFLSGSNKAISAFRSVRIFRTFRVLRVTRLLRGLKFMATILEVITRSMKSFSYILMLLLLFLFIFSLLGMQIYGG